MLNGGTEVLKNFLPAGTIWAGGRVRVVENGFNTRPSTLCTGKVQSLKVSPRILYHLAKSRRSKLQITIYNSYQQTIVLQIFRSRLRLHTWCFSWAANANHGEAMITWHLVCARACSSCVGDERHYFLSRFFDIASERIDTSCACTK